MKTFAEFQEAAIAVPAITGLVSKFALPAAATIIGGLGTYYQIRKAKKARKPYEKRKERSSKESKEDMLQRVRDAQERISNETDPDLNRPTDLDQFTGKKVNKKTLEKINKPENQFNSYNPIEEEAPTNNVGGGQIAGTVEAGDDPPVKKKKKKKGKKKTYAYGGRGSRKMWMA